jgi:hypothetical protein
MKTAWQAICSAAPQRKLRSAIDVQPLATNYPLASLLHDDPQNGADAAPIGLNDRDRMPALLELRAKGPHWMVTGPPMSGKSTTLQTAVLSLAHTHSPEELALILIDPSEPPRAFFNAAGNQSPALADLPHVLDTATTAAQVEAIIRRLKAELQTNSSTVASSTPERAIVIVIDNYEDAASLGITAMADVGKGRSLHFIVAMGVGAQRGIGDGLRRRIESARYGFVLQDAEAVRTLGVRLRGNPTRELPPGRGWMVKGTRATLAQIAISDFESPNSRRSGELVTVICSRWGKRAAWNAPLEIPAPDAPVKPSAAATTTSASAEATAAREAYDRLMQAQADASKKPSGLLSLDSIPQVSNLVSLEVEVPDRSDAATKTNADSPQDKSDRSSKP